MKKPRVDWFYLHCGAAGGFIAITLMLVARTINSPDLGNFWIGLMGAFSGLEVANAIDERCNG